jgi:hypothetical protein
MSIPAGHSPAAHLLIGRCASCPGWDERREVNAWRWWAAVHVPEVIDAVAQMPPRRRD